MRTSPVLSAKCRAHLPCWAPGFQKCQLLTKSTSEPTSSVRTLPAPILCFLYSPLMEAPCAEVPSLSWSNLTPSWNFSPSHNFASNWSSFLEKLPQVSWTRALSILYDTVLVSVLTGTTRMTSAEFLTLRLSNLHGILMQGCPKKIPLRATPLGKSSTSAHISWLPEAWPRAFTPNSCHLHRML